jgi:hypothetical protein
MRLSLLTLTLLAIALPAAAQETCGLPLVTVTVTPDPAPIGTPVLVTLTNNSSSTIQLPTSCTYQSVHEAESCSNSVVLAPFCAQVFTPIAPGQSSFMTWNQDDGSGIQVAAGPYAISISYWDETFSTQYSCCPSVLLGPGSGTGYCHGGSSGFPCPCGNNGTGDEGCANSTGSGAALSGSGAADTTADTLVLSAEQCPSHVPGLFFSGPGQLAGLPFGDGLRCVAGPIRRLGVVSTSAAGIAQTPWTLSVLEGLNPGDVRNYQYWYRDVPGPCNSGFNTTNGQNVQW